MSIRLVSECWEIVIPRNSGPNRSARDTKRAVLQVLADCASIETKLAWPSVDEIVWRIDKDRRTVQRALRDLEHDRLIEPAGETSGGFGNSTIYRLLFENAERKTPREKKGVARAALSERSRVVVAEAQQNDEPETPGEKGVAGDAPPPTNNGVGLTALRGGADDAVNNGERASSRAQRASQRATRASRTTPEPKNRRTVSTPVGATAVAPKDGDVFEVKTGSDGQMQVFVAGDASDPDNVVTVANVREMLAEIIGSDSAICTDRWKSRLGHEVKRLRDEGVPREVIVEAGQRLKAKGCSPSAIDGFVLEVSTVVRAQRQSDETKRIVAACVLCDEYGRLLGNDGTPIEPIQYCKHDDRTEGVA